MQFGKIMGVDKPFSRYIIGTMGFRDREKKEEYFAKLDQALACGMNAIDTARGYGMGVSEMVVAEWIKARGNREQVVLTTKGCHHNMWRDRCHDFDIHSDLVDSLARSGLEYFDIFYMHRDDPKVPVAEIMNALNEHLDAGHIKAIGVANWQIPRVIEANDYAAKNGLTGIAVVEEHYSIAEQLADPFNKGSGTISGPRWAEARRWLAETGMPVASYSVLSGGFVTGRITRELLEKAPDSIDPGVKKAYCHEINFKRLDRAAQLAEEKGVSIAQIGLAYAMSGAMDVYPIIGAANEEELRSSLEALELKLTRAECDWIDLTRDER